MSTNKMDIKTEGKIEEHLPLSTLLQLIPDFNTNDISQVYRYIRSCDSAFKLSTDTQCEILLVFALNKITGPFSSDVHAKQYKDWAELKIFLIQKFSQTKTLGHLHLELQSMFQKPTESVTDYLHRVDLCRNKILEKLAAEIKDESLPGRKTMTEESALNVFINGLNSDIGIMLRTREFKTLSEAGNFAMQEEKIRKMNSARQDLLSNQKITSRPPRPNTNSNSNRPQQSCNYCKKPGHLISECRKRAYNNNLKQQTNTHTNTHQNQRALPAPQHFNKSVNHLNSQAAVEMGMFTETASNNFSIAHTPTSNTEIQEL